MSVIIHGPYLNYCASFDSTVYEQPALVCHGQQSFSVDP